MGIQVLTELLDSNKSCTLNNVMKVSLKHKVFRIEGCGKKCTKTCDCVNWQTNLVHVVVNDTVSEVRYLFICLQNAMKLFVKGGYESASSYLLRLQQLLYLLPQLSNAFPSIPAVNFFPSYPSCQLSSILSQLSIAFHTIRAVNCIPSYLSWLLPSILSELPIAFHPIPAVNFLTCLFKLWNGFSLHISQLSNCLPSFTFFPAAELPSTASPAVKNVPSSSSYQVSPPHPSCLICLCFYHSCQTDFPHIQLPKIFQSFPSC